METIVTGLCVLVSWPAPADVDPGSAQPTRLEGDARRGDTFNPAGTCAMTRIGRAAGQLVAQDGIRLEPSLTVHLAA